MAKPKAFADGLKSLLNNLINRRSPSNTNTVVSEQMTWAEMNQIYKTGLGSKIVRLKTSYALNDTIDFASKEDEKFYNVFLARKVKLVSKWMLAFGRGIIVIHEKDGDMSKPLPENIDLTKTQLHVFSGDMVSVPQISRDLNENYYKPKAYMVRGFNFHSSRVIDFKYVEPTEIDAPVYQYGGISEYELIRAQIINDGIVERSSAHIVEKNSTLFYKYKGFKSALESGNEKQLLEFFKTVEDARSIYGAGIIDIEDDVTSVTQALTNLSDADMITLRRLAMVTGIPLAILVGENVKGLNSTGDNEKQSFQDMIETLQFDHLLEPINCLMMKLGKNSIEFKDNQGGTANEKIEFETKAIANAVNLDLLGEDAKKYLIDKGVIVEDAFDKLFKIEEVDESDEVLTDADSAS